MSPANKKVFRSVWLFIKYVFGPWGYSCFVMGDNLFPALRAQPWIFIVMLAAVFNAVMSSIDNIPHFTLSLFSRLNKEFWSKEDSSAKALRGGGYKFDMWHISQSIMIICFSLVCKCNYHFEWLDIVTFGFFYNMTFSLFYDIVLRRR